MQAQVGTVKRGAICHVTLGTFNELKVKQREQSQKLVYCKSTKDVCSSGSVVAKKPVVEPGELCNPTSITLMTPWQV